MFENSKFGDMLSTRDGRKAIFIGEWVKRHLGKEVPIYKCWVEDEDEPFDYEESGCIYGNSPTELEDGTIEYFGEDII